MISYQIISNCMILGHITLIVYYQVSYLKTPYYIATAKK